MTRENPQQAASSLTHQIGGSFLPSSEPRILQPMTGKHGTLLVRPLHDLDTYGLFYQKCAESTVSLGR